MPAHEMYEGGRRDFLESQREAYKEAFMNGTKDDFVKDVARRFFKRFPPTLADDVEPTEEFLAKVDDSQPDSEYVLPDASTMDPQEYEAAKQALLLLQDKVQMHTKSDIVTVMIDPRDVDSRRAALGQARVPIWSERTDRRIKRWYLTRLGKEEAAKGASVLKKLSKDVDLQDPLTVLTLRLLGNSASKPRKPIDYNLWAHDNRETVNKHYKLRDAAPKVRMNLKIRAEVAQELFKNQSPLVQKAYADKAEQQHADKVKKWEESLSRVDVSPQSQQKCIDGLAGFMQPVLDLVAAQTGMVGTLLMGGPEPASGGRLNVVSLHSGTTKGAVQAAFPEADVEAYQKRFLPIFCEFVQKCFTLEDCNASSLVSGLQSAAEKSAGQGLQESAMTAPARATSSTSMPSTTTSSATSFSATFYTATSSMATSSTTTTSTTSSSTAAPARSSSSLVRQSADGGRKQSRAGAVGEDAEMDSQPRDHNEECQEGEPRKSRKGKGFKRAVKAKDVDQPHTPKTTKRKTTVPHPDTPESIPSPASTPQSSPFPINTLFGPPAKRRRALEDLTFGSLPNISSPSPPSPVTSKIRIGPPSKRPKTSGPRPAAAEPSRATSTHAHINVDPLCKASNALQLIPRPRSPLTADLSPLALNMRRANVDLLTPQSDSAHARQVYPEEPRRGGGAEKENEARGGKRKSSAAEDEPAAKRQKYTRTGAHFSAPHPLPHLRNNVFSRSVAASSSYTANLRKSTSSKSSAPSSFPSAPPTTPISPLFAKLPADCDQAIKNTLIMSTAEAWGHKWERLVSTWLQFEESRGFQERGRFKGSGRPPSIAHWIKRARAPKYHPEIDVREFGQQFWAWWASLQPDWRKISPHTSERDISGSWDALDISGANGWPSVIASLVFWGNELGSDRRHMLTFNNAVADVCWVLEQLCSSHTAS
ncbi:hypothetical protein CVT26_005395 [Gymnopilus dilepis]|uniref:Uncharacterized protein n=1 Tax=Gymnopilus dilepis TaxID=231916 RepID=A0A409WH00_9AGAR|nr:hypothetical protein CVT26_005395 [Gymnopilus dilepis]